MRPPEVTRRRSRPTWLLFAVYPALWIEEGARALAHHHGLGILWVALGSVTFFLVVRALRGPPTPVRAPSGDVTFLTDLRSQAAVAVLGLSWITLAVVSLVQRPTPMWVWLDVVVFGLLGAMVIAVCVDLVSQVLAKVPGLVVGWEGLDVGVHSHMVHLEWDEIDHVELSRSPFRPGTLSIFARDPQEVVYLLPPHWRAASRRSIRRGGATLFVSLTRLGLSRRAASEGELASALDQRSGGRFKPRR